MIAISADDQTSFGVRRRNIIVPTSLERDHTFVVLLGVRSVKPLTQRACLDRSPPGQSVHSNVDQVRALVSRGYGLCPAVISLQ